MISTKEIAEELGIKMKSVSVYLSPNANVHTHMANYVRAYAEAHGWEPFAKRCATCNKYFKAIGGAEKYCPVCKYTIVKEIQKEKRRKDYYQSRESHYWFGGCFHTHNEEIKRMEELRAEGYSNKEIAKKIGRSLKIVYMRLGPQPEEITKQNRMLGKKFYAQKNAARKQYVINKPIIEYNKALNEVKVAAEHLEKLQQDLTAKEKVAKKNARRTVKTPSIDLSTTQIAG